MPKDIEPGSGAGTTGSPPAVVDAVLDAPDAGGYPVAEFDLPPTPARVWAAMDAAKRETV